MIFFKIKSCALALIYMAGSMVGMPKIDEPDEEDFLLEDLSKAVRDGYQYSILASMIKKDADIEYMMKMKQNAHRN